MNQIEITNTIRKVAALPAVNSAYNKAGSIVKNTMAVNCDPAEKSFTYEAKNGFRVNLNWERDTVAVSWADVILSFCWKDKKFEMNRSATSN